MKTLRIAPAEEGKGRSFEATMLAMVHATMLQQDGNSTIRPVWLMYAGTDEQIRAFTANLRTGRRAEVHKGYHERPHDQIELLKSAGYQYRSQRTSAGTVVTAFLPDLFRLDPGMVDPAGIKFCVLPAAEYVRKNACHVDELALTRHMEIMRAADKRRYGSRTTLESLIRLAPLFAAYLDRRTRCPLVSDPRFHLQLLAACATRGYARLSFDSESKQYYKEYGIEDVGLVPGMAFLSSHESMNELLAEETRAFFGMSERSAKAA